MTPTRTAAFVLGLLIGYELRDLRRLVPFAVEVCSNIKAIASGEFMEQLIADAEVDGEDE